MADMELTFDTERLKVFSSTVTPFETRGAQIVFLAFHREYTTPQPVAYATVSDYRTTGGGVFPIYCEWLQAAPPYLRNKYGRELFLGIEKHLGGTLAAVASTPEGEAFLKSLTRPVDSLEVKMNDELSPIIHSLQFKAMLENEEQQIARLSSDQNPFNPAFLGEKLEAIIRIAPHLMIKYLMTNRELAVASRIAWINRVLATLATDISPQT